MFNLNRGNVLQEKYNLWYYFLFNTMLTVSCITSAKHFQRCPRNLLLYKFKRNQTFWPSSTYPKWSLNIKGESNNTDDEFDQLLTKGNIHPELRGIGQKCGSCNTNYEIWTIKRSKRVQGWVNIGGYFRSRKYTTMKSRLNIFLRKLDRIKK